MKKSRWKTVGWYLFLLLFVLSLAALAQALMLGVLPMKYLAVVVAGVAVMDLFLYFMLNSRRVNRVNRGSTGRGQFIRVQDKFGF